jgi:cell wall-associated NlpC family hydrolase
MQLLKESAWRLVGLPYIWGGEHPSKGFDCSGLVQEILSSVGIDPKGDQTAQGLYDHFSPISKHSSYGIGALAFYGKSVKEINHVAFCLDNYRIIEAGGGDSTCVDIPSAIAKGAFVRIRLMSRRKDLVAVLKPSYASIGVIF